MERKRYDQIYFPVVPAVQSDIFIKLLASHFEVCKDALKIVYHFCGGMISETIMSQFYYSGTQCEGRNGRVLFIQGGPVKKNRTITGISVWGNFSWEKWYQDQQVWFSSLFSTAHFVRQCRGPKFSLFSNECHFSLPQLWKVIYSTLSMPIVKSRFQV